MQNIDTHIIQSISTQQAWHYHIVPYQLSAEAIYCYKDAQKTSEGIEEELELLFGKTVDLQTIDSLDFQQLLSHYYRRASVKNGVTKATTLKNEKDFLAQLIREAQQLESSDIHIEPYEERCRVRLRIDGVLIERYLLPKEAYPSLVNKVKIQANLDIAEKRLPQDGRIFYQEEGQRIDIRVSTLPTLYGEKIVMRLLKGSDTSVNIEKLGFEKEQLSHYLEGVQRPNGMVLISGPTGSGKTTTLYATLSVLNENSRNILTIEDPIEYTLEGINQVQLKEAIGLDFAGAMRTFLRQDPDIIMVGEIRDQATANMAIRASLTGHLVLSTIHTNQAWGIVARLMDMGVPSYLLADTLNTAVAQRLLRLLCPHCKVAAAVESHTLGRNYKAPRPLDKHFAPVGCDHCHYTGYKGRTAIYEVIPIDEELANLIKDQQLNVGQRLQQKGIKSLADQAFELLESGRTSAKEVFPILN